MMKLNRAKAILQEEQVVEALKVVAEAEAEVEEEVVENTNENTNEATNDVVEDQDGDIEDIAGE